MSFEEAYEEFKIYASRRHKKQSFDCLLYNFNANILSYFNNIDIFSINANIVYDWQKFILQKNFSNNHNKNLFGMLKSFFQFCHYKYDLNLSFMIEVEPFRLKVESKKVDFYNLKEFNIFIRCVEHPIYKQFFNFMYFVGTRPGEAMALHFSDLQGDFVFINKTIDEHGKRLVGTPKTMSSIRLVHLDKKLIRDLFILKQYYVKKYGRDDIDYFIFGGLKPLSPTTINRYKLKACDKCGLRSITLHQFRHSHATMLYQKGISIHEISKRLGHSNVSTTLNVYTHSCQEKRVINTLNILRFNIFGCLLYNFKNLISLFLHH